MKRPLATVENRARFDEIAGELDLAEETVARAWAALELVDGLEVDDGRVDELAVRRLIRRLDARDRPGAT